MTPLEDELRGSLARQAGHPSAAAADPVQLADRVIRRARRVRRRRRLGGATTALALAAATGMGVVYLPADEPARPVAQPSRPALLTPAAQVPSMITGDLPGRLYGRARAVPKLPVDVIADDQLVTVDGLTVDVSFAGEVIQAYRVDEGWLVAGVRRNAGTSVWLVTEAGRRQALLSDVAGVAFDTGGWRVAWRAGSRVYLGTLSGGRLDRQVESVLVAGSAVPAGFVGSAVLLTRDGAGGYDVWWPERGIFHPAWAQAAVAVYGSLADSGTAVGQVVVDAAAVEGGIAVGERRCLALFDASFQTVARAARGRPAQAPVRTRCRLGLGTRSPGWVSPDGRWLVTGAGERTVLVDLTAQTYAKPQVLSAGLPVKGGVAWLDDQTVVLATNSGKAVMRLRLDQLHGRQADGTKQVSIPVNAKEALLVVPRL